jgi:LPS-assembly lipoprotein
VSAVDRTRRWALLGLTVTAGACGFRPLYDQGGGEAGPVAAELARVAIAPVDAAPLDGRIGQVLRNELLRLFDPRGSGAAARYRLDIALASNSAALAISSDDTITRYNVILDATVVLVGIESGAELYRATTRAVGSYDAQRSDYGTAIAERSTREDAARDLGRRIAAMVSAVLAQRTS